MSDGYLSREEATAALEFLKQKEEEEEAAAAAATPPRENMKEEDEEDEDDGEPTEAELIHTLGQQELARLDNEIAAMNQVMLRTLPLVFLAFGRVLAGWGKGEKNSLFSLCQTSQSKIPPLSLFPRAALNKIMVGHFHFRMLPY